MKELHALGDLKKRPAVCGSADQAGTARDGDLLKANRESSCTNKQLFGKMTACTKR